MTLTWPPPQFRPHPPLTEMKNYELPITNYKRAPWVLLCVFCVPLRPVLRLRLCRASRKQFGQVHLKTWHDSAGDLSFRAVENSFAKLSLGRLAVDFDLLFRD